MTRQDTVELRILSSNEFKVVQYLKLKKNRYMRTANSKQSGNINMSDRTLRNCLQNLKYLGVISSKVPKGKVHKMYRLKHFSMWGI
jgi:hypothetical protein